MYLLKSKSCINIYWFADRSGDLSIHSCSILSAEFMRTSIQDTRDADSVILLQAKERAASLTNGDDDEISIVSYTVLSVLITLK